MVAPKRIVCYAINGSGLGHLTRLMSVARWLRRYVALLDQRSPEVLFLTSSDASDALADAGFAAFKIPSKTVAKKAELSKLEYRRLAKHFVWNTLGVFAPDLLVVDTFPSGSFDELFQVLDGPFKKGFIYRNVKPEYAARPTFRSAMGLYDTIVVPHQDRTNSNGHSTAGTSSTGTPTSEARYCGEVVQFEQSEMLPRDVVRQQLGIANCDRLVYVSAGGGGDPIAEATLAAIVKALKHEPNVHLLVGAGPLYRGRRFAGPRLTWVDSPTVWRFFSAVDAAISAGGYNTFHELLFARIPTAFFSQPKIADDQMLRITEANQLGACGMIADVTDEQSVVDELRMLLKDDVASRMREACKSVIASNGARRCAVELLRPLYGDDRLRWAERVLTPRIASAIEAIGGGTASLPNWLMTLLPMDQMRESAGHPGLEAVLDRLSPEASDEVRSILSSDTNLQDFDVFENHLLELLETVTAFEKGDGTESNGAETRLTVFADEILKTLAATIKKQPQRLAPESNSVTPQNGSHLAWIIEITQGVQSLLQLVGDDLTEPDVLRLYRMFPRIVDAGASESFDLFARFVQHRRSINEPIHETMHQLQVLKMSHQRITCATLEDMFEGSTT